MGISFTPEGGNIMGFMHRWVMSKETNSASSQTDSGRILCPVEGSLSKGGRSSFVIVVARVCRAPSRLRAASPYPLFFLL